MFRRKDVTAQKFKDTKLWWRYGAPSLQGVGTEWRCCKSAYLYWRGPTSVGWWCSMGVLFLCCSAVRVPEAQMHRYADLRERGCDEGCKYECVCAGRGCCAALLLCVAWWCRRMECPGTETKWHEDAETLLGLVSEKRYCADLWRSEGVLARRCGWPTNCWLGNKTAQLTAQKIQRQSQ